MTDIELLQLPKWCYADKHLHVGSAAIRKEMRAYARANVAHVNAAKDAEIEALRERHAATERDACRLASRLDESEKQAEALRAEVVRWKSNYNAAIELKGRAFAESDRLAEALRVISELDEREGDSISTARFIARAALRDHDQEATND